MELGARIPNIYVKKMDGAMIPIRKNMFTVVLINKTRKMDTEWSSTLETNKELFMKDSGETEEKKV